MPSRLALIFSMILLAGCQQKAVPEFSDHEGNFKVNFRAETNVTTETSDGVTFKTYSVESIGEKFMVGWADLPISGPESKAAIKARLYEARDQALESVKGKSKLAVKPIQLADRFPGIEFWGTTQGRHIRARVYLVGNRMYRLFVMARVEDVLTSEEGEGFLNSFALLEIPQGAPEGKVDEDEPEEEHPAETKSAESQKKLEKWVAFESRPGKFQSRFPTGPAESTRKLGEAEFSVYESSPPDVTCNISFADGSVPADEPLGKKRERLDEARDRVVKAAGGKLTWSNWFPLDRAHPGLEFAARIGDKQLRGRIYLVGDRTYHLTMLGNREYVSEFADAFFDSFRLAQ